MSMFVLCGLSESTHFHGWSNHNGDVERSPAHRVEKGGNFGHDLFIRGPKEQFAVGAEGRGRRE